MIRTTYTDGALIREHLARARGTEDEDRMLNAAAVLDDMGLTITDSEAEAAEVRAKIPAHLLYGVCEVKGQYIVLHGRIEGLEAST